MKKLLLALLIIISASVKVSAAEITIYNTYTEEEVNLLFRVVETETHGADYESKKNVASVVFNRQEQYDKSLKDIITAKNQFAYSKTTITASTIKACEDALLDRGSVENALFFHAGKQKKMFYGREYITSDSAGHNFY